MENQSSAAQIKSETHGLAAFIDVETTGLDPFDDEIIEFSIVLFEFDRKTGEFTDIIDEYTGLKEPIGKRIPRAATRVNGITNDMVEGEELDDDKIISLIHSAEFIVAHNAKFDRSFVEMEYPKLDWTNKPWLCSMNGIGWKRKGFASKGLQNLLKDHGIEVNNAHRAANDVRAALMLLSQKNSKGEYYFKELLRNNERKEKARLKKIQNQVAENQVRPEPREKQSLEMKVNIADVIREIQIEKGEIPQEEAAKIEPNSTKSSIKPMWYVFWLILLVIVFISFGFIGAGVVVGGFVWWFGRKNPKNKFQPTRAFLFQEGVRWHR
ncbi:exonuclease domain-containing protein [Effusibacillus dendaii]|uniref:exonuclease domain-containing protein n=1 Tax=Effusibacillus dendaii TaxID=2743772 RepID=UPI00190C7008|nr:exonuclease domain-containing protein [Effusibacillus dendaii]